MQRILSRTGQSQHCRCKTCSQVSKTVVRRSTTQSAFRKPTFSEAFVATYTSVFATAAIVDAKQKDDRRKELDRKVDDARAQLATLQATNEALFAKHRATRAMLSEATGAKAESAQPDPYISSRSSVSFEHHRTIARQYYTEWNKGRIPRYHVWDEYADGHWDLFKKQNSKASIRLLKRPNYGLLHKWLESTDKDCSLSRQLKRTAKNPAGLVEACVAELVGSLLAYAPSGSNHSSATIAENVDTLLTNGYPRYSLDDSTTTSLTSDYQQLRKRLYEEIRANRTDPIGVICETLLQSRVPPTVHTFNWLIVYLDELRLFDLAQVVLKARRRTFKRNVHTWIVDYHHNQASGAAGFIRRDLDYLLTKTNLLSQRNMITSQPNPSDPVQQLLTSIVKSLLSIHNLRDAAAVLCHGLRLHYTTYPWVAMQLFAVCIYSFDRAAALTIIRSFVDFPRTLAALRRHSKFPMAVLIHQIRYMLDMCHLSRKPEKLSNELASLGLDPKRFSKFIRWLQFHELNAQVVQSERVTRQLRKLFDSQQGLSREQLIHKAVEVARNYSMFWSMASPNHWPIPRSMSPLHHSRFFDPPEGQQAKCIKSPWDDDKDVNQHHAFVQRRDVWDQLDVAAARRALRMASLGDACLNVDSDIVGYEEIIQQASKKLGVCATRMASVSPEPELTGLVPAISPISLDMGTGREYGEAAYA